jgi:hypothetical protein
MAPRLSQAQDKKAESAHVPIKPRAESKILAKMRRNKARAAGKFVGPRSRAFPRWEASGGFGGTREKAREEGASLILLGSRKSMSPKRQKEILAQPARWKLRINSRQKSGNGK